MSSPIPWYLFLTKQLEKQAGIHCPKKKKREGITHGLLLCPAWCHVNTKVGKNRVQQRGNYWQTLKKKWKEKTWQRRKAGGGINNVILVMDRAWAAATDYSAWSHYTQRPVRSRQAAHQREQRKKGQADSECEFWRDYQIIITLYSPFSWADAPLSYSMSHWFHRAVSAPDVTWRASTKLRFTLTMASLHLLHIGQSLFLHSDTQRKAFWATHSLLFI